MYQTGDGRCHATLESALAHAARVFQCTGWIIEVRKIRSAT